MRDKNSAFTLVELAIVIVIIGLLVGGVLQGQELIRVSKINAVIKDMQGYKAAMWGYYGKYNGFPGDHNKASAFFGAADGDDAYGADCIVIPSVGTETCNGNGDTKIDGTLTDRLEKMRFWQHLSAAKLIKGFFTGAFTSQGFEPGVNVPLAPINSATYEVHYQPGLYGKFGTFIKIARVNAVANTGVNFAGMSPVEAEMADRKMDDGLSNAGVMMAIDSENISGCVTNGVTFSAGTTGSYILNSPDSEKPSCRFYVFMD
jgi:prepilin-type N-terminal cleavage/methylation domain-containing protein